MGAPGSKSLQEQTAAATAWFQPVLEGFNGAHPLEPHALGAPRCCTCAPWVQRRTIVVAMETAWAMVASSEPQHSRC